MLAAATAQVGDVRVFDGAAVQRFGGLPHGLGGGRRGVRAGAEHLSQLAIEQQNVLVGVSVAYCQQALPKALLLRLVGRTSCDPALKLGAEARIIHQRLAILAALLAPGEKVVHLRLSDAQQVLLHGALYVELIPAEARDAHQRDRDRERKKNHPRHFA